VVEYTINPLPTAVVDLELEKKRKRSEAAKKAAMTRALNKAAAEAELAKKITEMAKKPK
jgi:hypothetical protein